MLVGVRAVPEKVDSQAPGVPQPKLAIVIDPAPLEILTPSPAVNVASVGAPLPSPIRS